jgi:hypothetical protein
MWCFCVSRTVSAVQCLFLSTCAYFLRCCEVCAVVLFNPSFDCGLVKGLLVFSLWKLRLTCSLKCWWVTVCHCAAYYIYTLTALICNGGWKLCIDLTVVNPRKPIHSDRTEVPPLLQASLNILCMVCVVRAACYLTVGCLTSLVFSNPLEYVLVLVACSLYRMRGWISIFGSADCMEDKTRCSIEHLLPKPQPCPCVSSALPHRLSCHSLHTDEHVPSNRFLLFKTCSTATWFESHCEHNVYIPVKSITFYKVNAFN